MNRVVKKKVMPHYEKKIAASPTIFQVKSSKRERERERMCATHDKFSISKNIDLKNNKKKKFK